jgi:hypothetical protein
MYTVTPVVLKEDSSICEPEKFKNGTLELTNVPSWYISIVPPPLLGSTLYTPTGT